MAKASPAQAWLWHRRLSHLNFDAINMLSKNNIVNGLLKLIYVKDQLCSSCDLGKAKRSSFKPKIVPSSKGRLHLLHMDLCGLMRIERINGKKYVLEYLSFKAYIMTSRVCVELSILATTLKQARKIYIELGSTSGIRACRETLNDEIPPPPPPPQTQTPTQQAPHTVSTIKLPILKKGEYDIWAMKMEHYLAHTDYPIWEVIQRGNGPVSVSTDTNGVIKVLPPKTAEEILARERERRARTTLLMALPEDHLAKFHKITDAKEIWEAIKSRFGGNDESKKMQKYILKQQFEGFYVSNSEGLHKGYDRFQSLLSQLEIHGAGVSTKDANQKLLRSLPSAWSQVSLIMRTKPRVDSLSFDDLYNNIRVFESDVKGSTASSFSTQNVAFVFENTSSSSSYTDELMYSFFANQSTGPQLDHEDLEQLDEFDLEEMDLKWQVAMISMRLKKFYKKTGRKLQFDAKEPVGFDKTKVECYNCHKSGNFARECRSKGNQDSRRRDAWNTGNKDKDNERRSGKQEEPKALVTLDEDGVDWRPVTQKISKRTML
ncbi:ribonuclease H-like domain-containing protein [Tanacetum coccineum]